MSDDNVTVTPLTEFDSNGYYVLKGECGTQRLFRVEGHTFYFWNKIDRCEYPLTLSEIVSLVEQIND